MKQRGVSICFAIFIIAALALFGPPVKAQAVPDACNQADFDDLTKNKEDGSCLYSSDRIIKDGPVARILTLREGKKDYPNPFSSDDPEMREHDCSEWNQTTNRLESSPVCHCQESVKYVRVDGESDGIRRINAAEKKIAESYECSADDSGVGRSILALYTHPGFLSLATFQEHYCQGCGGSCHGNHTFTTFDLRRGTAYVLADIVDMTQKDSLFNALADQFLKKFGDRIDPNEQQKLRKSVMTILSKIDFQKDSVYLERSKVFVNVEDFIFSCADGNLFPIQIPASFIKADFAEKIKIKATVEPSAANHDAGVR